MLMATAVTIFFRSPILPSSRNSRNARSTRSCFTHALPPPPLPVLCSPSRAMELTTTPVSNRDHLSAQAVRGGGAFSVFKSHISRLLLILIAETRGPIKPKGGLP
jgi:hypothetical protein